MCGSAGESEHKGQYGEEIDRAGLALVDLAPVSEEYEEKQVRYDHQDDRDYPEVNRMEKRERREHHQQCVDAAAPHAICFHRISFLL